MGTGQKRLLPPPSLARKVSEQFLDVTGRCLMDGDVDTFTKCFHLPQEIETLDGIRRMETRADLEDAFHSVRRHFEQSGVTELHRVCVAAEFMNPDTIVTTHKTRLLSGTTLKQSPYPSISILRRVEDAWKIAHTKYAITDSPRHCLALLGEDVELFAKDSKE